MYATLILGGGPGGTGPLVWAAQNGELDEWLAGGVAIVDRQGRLGGTLDRYAINSDSRGAVYLECLDAAPAAALFSPLRNDPAYHALEPMRSGFPPLQIVSRYLQRLSATIENAIRRTPGCDFLSNTSILSLHLRDDHSIIAETCDRSGEHSFIEARTAIMALGGRHNADIKRDAELVPGIRFSDTPAHKVIFSDALLTADGLAKAAEMMASSKSRRVVVLGGSHSGFSIAWALTSLMPQAGFDQGDIVILMRKQPPIFYESADAAAADNYAITPADICPRTQRVNRFGGLRGDGREMWRRIMACPGTEQEHRVTMVSLREPDMSPDALRRLFDEAAVIVPAFGYRAMTVPVFAADGRRLPLAADHSTGPSVGPDTRILLTDGTPIPNLFGIGLGSGFKPYGDMGGEASFVGQANSLWLYQNDIGAVVYRGIFECLTGTQPAPDPATYLANALLATA